MSPSSRSRRMFIRPVDRGVAPPFMVPIVLDGSDRNLTDRLKAAVSLNRGGAAHLQSEAQGRHSPPS
jgi:hypothetical protein